MLDETDFGLARGDGIVQPFNSLDDGDTSELDSWLGIGMWLEFLIDCCLLIDLRDNGFQIETTRVFDKYRNLISIRSASKAPI
jgi:hypothetical protein